MLFALGVSLPLETIGNVHLGLVTVTPSRGIGIAVLLFGFLDLALSGPRIPRNPKNLWFAAFFVALVLGCAYGSLFSGMDPIYYVLIWTRYGSLILLYFLLCQLIADRRDLDFFLGGLVAGGALATVSAVFGDVTIHESVERRSGVGAGANQHAGNLLMVIPLTYALFLSTRWRILKPILAGTALFLSAGVVMAASRSAFLSAHAMGGGWLIRFRRLSALN
jgi:hypothetical protein